MGRDSEGIISPGRTSIDVAMYISSSLIFSSVGCLHSPLEPAVRLLTTSGIK